MKNGFQVQKSDLLVIGTFLLLGGLVLLVTIDFLWGVLCFVLSFTCFNRAHALDKEGTGPNRRLGDW